jgi:hypothetical protein
MLKKNIATVVFSDGSKQQFRMTDDEKDATADWVWGKEFFLAWDDKGNEYWVNSNFVQGIVWAEAE